MKSQYISQVFVHGDGLQSYLVALVVVDPDQVKEWMKGQSKTGEPADHLQAMELRKAVLEQFTKRAQEAGLAGFEKIKNVYLTLDAFTVENGLLTPKMSVKRHEVKKKYEKELQGLYEEGMIC